MARLDAMTGGGFSCWLLFQWTTYCKSRTIIYMIYLHHYLPVRTQRHSNVHTTSSQRYLSYLLYSFVLSLCLVIQIDSLRP